LILFCGSYHCITQKPGRTGVRLPLNEANEYPVGSAKKNATAKKKAKAEFLNSLPDRLKQVKLHMEEK